MLIGVTGKKRSGKDTLAQALIGAGFVRVAFADPIRALAYALDPLVWVEADEQYLLPPAVRFLGRGSSHRLAWLVDVVGWEAAKNTREVRRTLQRLGADAGRAVLGESVWLDLGMTAALRHPDVVITDVRFPDEADAVRTAGGLVVRVTRPGVTSTDTHATETAMDGYPVDVELINDTTIDALHAAALTLIRGV